MANLGPLAAEIGSVVWGTPANFNGFRVLAALLQRRRSTKANQTLHGVWRLLGWYTTYTFSEALAPLRNFARCKIHFASSSHALWYFGSVTARHLTSWREPNFAALSGRATITLGIGPHSSYGHPM